MLLFKEERKGDPEMQARKIHVAISFTFYRVFFFLLGFVVAIASSVTKARLVLELFPGLSQASVIGGPGHVPQFLRTRDGYGPKIRKQGPESGQ